MESQIDGRLGRLEASVAHIQTDVADIKVELRATNQRIDSLRDDMFGRHDGLRAQMNSLHAEVLGRIDDVRTEMLGRIDDVRTEMVGRIDDLRTEMTAGFAALRAEINQLRDSIASTRVWGLSLYVGSTGGLLLVMAHGFKWL